MEDGEGQSAEIMVAGKAMNKHKIDIPVIFYIYLKTKKKHMLDTFQSVIAVWAVFMAKDQSFCQIH